MATQKAAAFCRTYVLPLISVFYFLSALTSCHNSNKKNTLPPPGAASIARPDSTLHRKADSLISLGDRLMASGLRDSALLFFEKALAYRASQKPDKQLIGTYLKTGSWYFENSKFEIADKLYEKALLFSEKTGLSNLDKVNIYQLLATSKREMKDLPMARSLVQQALKLTNENTPQRDSLLAKCYELLGSISYVEHNYDEAISNISYEIGILKRSGKTRELGKLYSNQALIYNAQGEFAKALNAVNLAIQCDMREFGSTAEQIGRRYLNKGSIFQRKGNYDSALFYFHKNLAIRKGVYGAKHPNVFGAYYTIAGLFSAQAFYDSAVYYYQKCLIALVKDFHDPDMASNPRPSLLDSNKDLLLALVAKASALRLYAQNHPNNPSILVSALKTYFLSDSVFNIYRQNLAFDDPKLSHLEDHLVPYAQMVSLSTELFEKTKDDEFLHYAFTAMEHSKAVVLHDALVRSQAYNHAGLPDALRQKEKRIIKARSNLLFELSKVPDSPGRKDSLNELLIGINKEQISLQEELSRFSSSYLQLRYPAGELHLEDLQRMAKDHRALFVEFFWNGDILFRLAVSMDSISVKSIPVTDECRRAVRNISDAIAGTGQNKHDFQNFRHYCDEAYFLYALLLKDIVAKNQGADRLIICADGMLTSFPFEVLLTEKVERTEVDYHLPYLFKALPVSYIHSGNLLKLQSSSPRHGSRLLALGYGSDSAKGTAPLLSLPGTETELSSIRTVFSDKENRFYSGSTASEKLFKEKSQEFDILHLAVHGLADTVHALESRLVFPSAGDSTDDGNLYAHELYDLNLRPVDLTVLSACESGIGKFQAGEGVMSIARGFMYAGCPTLIMSLWKADDQTSSEIMKNFYQHIADGTEMDQALASAKLEYLESSNEFNSHPSYWAMFIQLGDTRPLKKQEIRPLFLWTVFLVLLVFVLYYFMKNRTERIPTRKAPITSKASFTRLFDPTDDSNGLMSL